MADPMRAEEVTLKDRRRVVIRPSRLGDAESLLRNVNLIGREEVYILIDQVAPDLEHERQWLGTFDGVRAILFVADADGEAIGSADCHGGTYAKTRHVGGIGIAIRDGWRGVGLGRMLMERILEWIEFVASRRPNWRSSERMRERTACTNPSASRTRASADAMCSSAALTKTKSSWVCGCKTETRRA